MTRDLGPYGRLTMQSLADPDTGTVRYQLRCPHVRGSVVMVPALLLADPILAKEPGPIDLYLFARLDNAVSGQRDERPLTINGIELAGRIAVDTRSPYTIDARRTTQNGSTERMPRSSWQLARAVLGTAAEHWAQREDRNTLEGLARQSTAQHYLDIYESALEQRRQAVERAERGVAQAQRDLDQLRILAAPDGTPAAAPS
ncbi:hypothetical protein QMK19_38635 [Streptomyces sp. H10-C2]|uniref:hypothetical protein n=1 Tax=unclassified Streptomyces TaxID=2593676 RepID=UPI0024BB3105|nr:MULTISPECIES: hypothetical protein [unclassified Streptomyces]MDJ0346818.1 hypothetical protein [Streptomyces sp. PH10-H1]MDJ0375357.1 hypothetical protein [Streptomyces sp. H10-C2]